MGSGAAHAVVNPVGYWNFENSLQNQVTGGLGLNAGVLTNAPSYATGRAGTGLSFDNSVGESIQLPFGSNALGDSFTISAWYRQTDDLTDGRNFVFESQGNYDVSYGDGGSNNFTSYVGQVGIGTTTTSAEQWHHVLHSFSSDGSNTTLNAYIDGVLMHSGSATTSSVDFPAINVGTYRSANGRWWDGMIDEVALWDRALNTAEAAEVYNRGLGGLELQYTPAVVDLGGTQDQFSLDVESSLPSGVILDGWTVDSFTPAAGPENDLGDAGFSDTQYLRTQGAGDNTLALRFENLPWHTEIDLGMILAQLDSLDPTRDGDRLTVKIDGEELLSVGLGFGDAGAYNEPLVDNPLINGQPVDDSVILDTMTLGGVNLYADGLFPEHVYDFGQLSAFQGIPHTGNSLSIEIIGFQNQPSGEFFALDNLSVAFVPEPGTALMAAIGLLGLLLVGGRRAKKSC